MLYIAGISTIKVDKIKTKKTIKLKKKETASTCRSYAEPVTLPYSHF